MQENEINAYKETLTASLRWTALCKCAEEVIQGEKTFPADYFAKTVKITYDLFAEMRNHKKISVYPSHEEIGAIGYLTIAHNLFEYSILDISDDKSENLISTASIIVVKALLDKILDWGIDYEDGIIDIFPIFPDMIDYTAEEYFYDVEKGDLSDIIRFIEKCKNTKEN